MPKAIKSPRNRPPIGLLAVAAATTMVSGAVFYYAAQKTGAEIYPWFLSGAAAAFISCLGAALAWRLWHGNKHPVDADHLRDRLIMAGAGRKLGHEAGNFLNNADLVVHGLKNEPLSPGGKRILQLLAWESTRFKTYIQKYRGIFKHPETFETRRRDITPVIQGAVSSWAPAGERPAAMARFEWPAAPAMVRMNPKLVGEAVMRLLSFISHTAAKKHAAEINGRIEGVKLTVVLAHADIGRVKKENVDLSEPFNASDNTPGALSSLFVARIIVEAHGGTLGCIEDPQGNPAFEITLPLSGGKPKTT